MPKENAMPETAGATTMKLFLAHEAALEHAAARIDQQRQTILIGAPPGDQDAQPFFLPRAQRFLLARTTTPTPSR